MKVKFCKDCVWSEVSASSAWELRCKNPIINANDEWALADVKFVGTNCREERKKKWFAKCGMSGKLWVEKDG